MSGKNGRSQTFLLSGHPGPGPGPCPPHICSVAGFSLKPEQETPCLRASVVKFPRLLRPQRRNRVHSRRPACGHVAGDQRHDYHRKRDRDKRYRVATADAVEETFHQPRGGQGCDQPDSDADPLDRTLYSIEGGGWDLVRQVLQIGHWTIPHWKFGDCKLFDFLLVGKSEMKQSPMSNLQCGFFQKSQFAIGVGSVYDRTSVRSWGICALIERTYTRRGRAPKEKSRGPSDPGSRVVNQLSCRLEEVLQTHLDLPADFGRRNLAEA